MRNRYFVFCFLLIISFLGFGVSVYGKNASYFVGFDSASSALGGTAIADPQGIIPSIYVNPASMMYFNDYWFQLDGGIDISLFRRGGYKNKSVFQPHLGVSSIFPAIPERLYVGLALVNPVYDEKTFDFPGRGLTGRDSSR